MFFTSIHYFRAIAIVIIVISHCYHVVKWDASTFIEQLALNLITGGTTLFVFISGFLFFHISYKKYDYLKFMKAKILYVLVPYLILNIPLAYDRVSSSRQHSYFLPDGVGFYAEYIKPVFLYLFTGNVTLASWYIPFAMMLFSISPLFIRFANLQFKNKLIITLVFLFSALLLHRPSGLDNFLQFQHFFYFLPVFLIGILCSQYRSTVQRVLAGKEYILLLIAIFIAVIQITIAGKVGHYVKPPFTYAGLDLMLLQKLFLCLFFMMFLGRFEDTNNKTLNLLATASFAIFFLHVFVIKEARSHQEYILSTGLADYILLPIVGLFVIIVSLALALLTKKIFKGRSRYIIGW